jgi:Mrp family chromosome partitioning ATPase
VSERRSSRSLALVRAQPTESEIPLDDAERERFVAGIRALYGQLACCEPCQNGSLRSIGVTSCCRQEGKSTDAAHLAAVAAESQRVLLVEAGVSRSQACRAIQDTVRSVSAAKCESLAVDNPDGDSSCTKRFLIAQVDGRPATVHETREMMQSLSAEFDLVIVDLPALDAPGALEWGSLVDGILVVIEAERVRWQVVERGIGLLEQAGSTVLGTVINKRRDYIPNWLYKRL